MALGRLAHLVGFLGRGLTKLVGLLRGRRADLLGLGLPGGDLLRDLFVFLVDLRPGLLDQRRGLGTGLVTDCAGLLLGQHQDLLHPCPETRLRGGPDSPHLVHLILQRCRPCLGRA